MALFNFGKKESCCCGGKILGAGKENCDCVSTSAGIQSVKVLGAGCKSCHEMYENTKKAVRAAGIEIEVEYVTDMEKVMTYGIMSMPGLVVNEKVVSVGKVLKPVEIEKVLKYV